KTAEIDYIDYKDVALLRKFISDRGKIRARRVTGVTVQEQRKIARAIKNASEMALLPYSSSNRKGGGSWQANLSSLMKSPVSAQPAKSSRSRMATRANTC